MSNTLILKFNFLKDIFSPYKPGSKGRFHLQAASFQTLLYADNMKATQQALGWILHFTFLVNCHRFLNVQKALYVNRVRKK